MMVLVAISIRVDDDPNKFTDEVLETLHHLNPPSIPNFSGEVRVVIPEHYGDVIAFMDEKA